MDTRPDLENEANVEESIVETLIALPPAWLVILIRALTPPARAIVPPEEESASRSFILDMFWPLYQSAAQVLLRVPRGPAWTIPIEVQALFDEAIRQHRARKAMGLAVAG